MESDECINGIALSELFNPRRHKIKSSDSPLMINARVNYSRVIDNIFNTYAKLIDYNSYADSFALKCQWNYFKDCTMDLINDLYDLECSDNMEANRLLDSINDAYRWLMPESKWHEFNDITYGLKRLIDDKLVPVHITPDGEIYNLMYGVIHYLVFNFNPLDLTDEQRSLLRAENDEYNDSNFKALIGATLLSELTGEGDVATHIGDLMGNELAILGNESFNLDDLYEARPVSKGLFNDFGIPESLNDADSLSEALLIYEDKIKELINGGCGL